MAGKSVLFTTQNRADVSSQSDVPQIEKLVDFVTLIFEGPQEYQGLVTIVCGSNKGAMKPVMTVPVHAIEEKLKELVIHKNRNYYMTKGQTMQTGHWRDKDLFSINALYIDIDNHTYRSNRFLKNDYADENEIIRRIYSNLVYEDLILEPNIVVYTGRGIHLVWLVQQAAANLKGLYRFVCSQYCHMISKVIETYNEEMHTRFSVDEACSKKAMGLTRLPETFNTASGDKSFFRVIHEARFDLAKEFDTQLGRAEMRGYQPMEKNRKPKKKFERHPVDSKSAGKARVNSLLKLKERRGNNMEGYRAKFLMVLFSALEMSGMEKTEALKVAIEVDSTFCRPLGSKKVKNYLSSAMRKFYKFKNSTIIDWLDISEGELEDIGLKQNRKQSSKEKNASRDRRVAEKRDRRNRTVIRLWKAGYNKSEIARKEGLARNTVTSIIKKYVAGEEAERYTKELAQKKQQEEKRQQAEARAHMWRVFWNLDCELIKKCFPRYTGVCRARHLKHDTGQKYPKTPEEGVFKGPACSKKDGMI